MVHVSGFYAWHGESFSQHAQEDVRQTELIRQAWTDSGKVYDRSDLRDQGEIYSQNRVARLASLAGITVQISHKRRLGRGGVKSAVVVDTALDWQFGGAAPDKVGGGDITYINTHEY